MDRLHADSSVLHANWHSSEFGLHRATDEGIETGELEMTRLQFQRCISSGLSKFRLRDRSIFDTPRQHAANFNALSIPDVGPGESVAWPSREADGCSSRTRLAATTDSRGTRRDSQATGRKGRSSQRLSFPNYPRESRFVKGVFCSGVVAIHQPLT